MIPALSSLGKADGNNRLFQASSTILASEAPDLEN
jgi:hypothetical protein